MPRYDEDDELDPGFEKPRRVKKKGMSTAAVIGLSIGAVVLCVICCCGGFLGYGWYLMSPSWQIQTSSAGDFTYKMPQPKAKLVTSPDVGPDGKSYTMTTATYGVPKSTFVVRERAITPQEAKQPSTLLKTTADAFARKSPGLKEDSRNENLADDHPSLDLELSQKDKRWMYRFVVTKNKLVILMIESQIYELGDEVTDEFFDSLTFTGK